MSTHVDTQTKSATNGSARSLIDAVGVTVETHLGGAKMTVAELNALAPGGVVTLEAALNAPVELRVNGVAIALGELVAVGDKFGVRITSLAP
jgi:flagellar motor switch protein FliN/FliY